MTNASVFECLGSLDQHRVYLHADCIISYILTYTFVLMDLAGGRSTYGISVDDIPASAVWLDWSCCRSYRDQSQSYR